MPPGGGGLYLEGRLNGGFLRYEFWGAYIWTGLYMEGLIFGVLRYLRFLVCLIVNKCSLLNTA